jgi:hypothetical protein
MMTKQLPIIFSGRLVGSPAEVVGNQWLLIKWYASLNQNRRDCKLEADAARQAYVTVRHHALPSLKITRCVVGRDPRQKICGRGKPFSFMNIRSVCARGLNVAVRNVALAQRLFSTRKLESLMKKLAIVIAVGATALMAGSAANAADNSVKAKTSTDVSQSSTDISSRHRHGHWRGHHHHHRHWGHRHYRPYQNSYGYYAPRGHGYYGGPRYYGGGGPGVTFSFGSGGYRGW